MDSLTELRSNVVGCLSQQVGSPLEKQGIRWVHVDGDRGLVANHAVFTGSFL